MEKADIERAELMIEAKFDQDDDPSSFKFKEVPTQGSESCVRVTGRDSD